ncbi:SRPBCC family protein [Ramlibacter pallidus]|uniref:SRPBCC domain-containing protein n=1 Tax=Ramlibacter pallidus TaxID=2780087 RepID=A0ABR9S5Y8_9BURK|nr:SRPBCC domain-containing protein [Ramlibacter pallidus]MBE7368925.1 SRPBCC domain-containing protein [Ramlibacter pallidus]
MFNIVHRIGIQAPASRVYPALSTIEGLAGWWTRDTTGQSKVGESIAFTFRTKAGAELGRFDMEVLELSPGDRVRWRVKSGPADWVGTEVSFALAEQDGMTIVLFGHRGWREQGESMSHCSMKWAVFLLSLRDLVEKGAGQPCPDDVKIDNWN